MELPLRRVLHVDLAIRTLGEKRTGFSLGAAPRVARHRGRDKKRQKSGRPNWDVQDEEGLERTWPVHLDGAETLT